MVATPELYQGRYRVCVRERERKRERETKCVMKRRKSWKEAGCVRFGDDRVSVLESEICSENWSAHGYARKEQDVRPMMSAKNNNSRR